MGIFRIKKRKEPVECRACGISTWVLWLTTKEEQPYRRFCIVCNLNNMERTLKYGNLQKEP